MERVKKGEKYWCVQCEYDVYPQQKTDYEKDTFAEHLFKIGNYFHTKEEAESMARKLRAVLNGADVIEMPKDEDIKAVAIRHCGLLAQWSGSTVDAFIDCAEWLKSKCIR